MIMKKLKVGVAIMTACVMLLGTATPANAAEENTTEVTETTDTTDESDTTEVDEEEEAKNEEWHKSFFFYMYHDDIKVTVTKGEDIKDYPYLLKPDIYPTAKYLVEDSTGRIMRGLFCEVDGHYMCSDDNGEIVTRRWMEVGVSKIDGGWIVPAWVYFDENGYALTNQWVYLGNVWYYLGERGAMQTGWTKVGDTWYFMDEESGAMKTGWIRYDK